jgi:hypothetical protein
MKLSYPEPKTMDEFWIIEKAKENESFRDMILYKKDITKLVKEDIRKRVTGKIPDHCIIQAVGRTNSGKSITGICSIARDLICPSMTIKNVCFSGEQVLERVKELKRDTVIVLDEQIASAGGVGSVREALELRNLEEVTRKYKLSFVFLSPTMRQHLTAHYTLETFYKDVKKKENWLAVVEDGVYRGYIRLKVDPQDPLWLEYDKPDGIKNKFIEQYIERKAGARLDYAKMAKEVVKDDRVRVLTTRKGFVKMDEMFYIIGRHYPSITQTERKELITELKIMSPELFTKSQ